MTLALLLALGCGPQAHREPLSVFAASSLTEAFEELERKFEAEHPDTDVQLTFGGSQILRMQIEQGARADVFAAADERQMRALVDAELASPSHTFAHNSLVVIVPRDDPTMQSFEELAAAERVVIGSPTSPIGAYTRSLFDHAEGTLGTDFADRVRGHVVSEESNTRLVRAKVELGEADAGIVYRTDTSANVRTVQVPDGLQVHAAYPVATLSEAVNAAGADALVVWLQSPNAQRGLREHRFTTVTP